MSLYEKFWEDTLPQWETLNTECRGKQENPGAPFLLFEFHLRSAQLLRGLLPSLSVSIFCILPYSTFMQHTIHNVFALFNI